MILNLDHNELDSSAAVTIADALKTNRTLKHLSLYVNQIGNSGVRALADMLRINDALTVIDLDYNKVDDTGAIALADVLKVNRTLKSLELGYNKIGNTGAIALADALKVNRDIRQLKLQGGLGCALSAGLDRFGLAMSIGQYSTIAGYLVLKFSGSRADNTISEENLAPFRYRNEYDKYSARMAILAPFQPPVTQPAIAPVVRSVALPVVSHRQDPTALSQAVPQESVQAVSSINYQRPTKDLWSEVTTSSSLSGLAPPFCVLFSMQGNSESSLQYLTKLEQEVQILEPRFVLQDVWDATAGTGPAGVLAWSMNVPEYDCEDRYHYKIQDLASDFANFSVENTGKLQTVVNPYKNKRLDHNNWKLRKSVKPFLCTVRDCAYSSFDNQAGETVEDLSRRMIENVGSDPSVILLSFARSNREVAKLGEQVLLISLGVVEGSKSIDETLREIPRDQKVFYIRPHCPKIFDQSIGARLVRAFSNEANPASISELAKLLVANHRMKHTQVVQFQPALHLSLEPYDQLIKAEINRLKELNEVLLCTELRDTRVAGDSHILGIKRQAIISCYDNRKVRFLQGVLDNGLKIFEKLEGMAYGTGPVLNSLQTRTQTTMAQYGALITRLKSNSKKEVQEALRSFYTWKQAWWYQSIHQQMEVVLVTCEALSYGTVERKRGFGEKLAGLAGEAVSFGAEHIPLVGPTLSKIVSKGKDVALERYYGARSRERTQRVTALYNTQGLEEMLKICKKVSAEFLWRLKGAECCTTISGAMTREARDLTPQSLIVLASLVVNQLVDKIVEINARPSLTQFIGEMKTYQTGTLDNIKQALGITELIDDTNTPVRPEEILRQLGSAGSEAEMKSYAEGILKSCNMQDAETVQNYVRGMHKERIRCVKDQAPVAAVPASPTVSDPSPHSSVAAAYSLQAQNFLDRYTGPTDPDSIMRAARSHFESLSSNWHDYMEALRILLDIRRRNASKSTSSNVSGN